MNDNDESATASEALDRAHTLIADSVARARRGEGLNVQEIFDRWDGGTFVLMAAALVAAVGRQPDQDPNPAPRDFRRATAFLAGWATDDPAVFSPPIEEADADGRMQHLLAAVAGYAVIALGLRGNPDILGEIRRSIAMWTQEENKETN